jgi:hypothetical protein
MQMFMQIIKIDSSSTMGDHRIYGVARYQASLKVPETMGLVTYVLFKYNGEQISSVVCSSWATEVHCLGDTGFGHNDRPLLKEHIDHGLLLEYFAG